MCRGLRLNGWKLLVYKDLFQTPVDVENWTCICKTWAVQLDNDSSYCCNAQTIQTPSCRRWEFSKSGQGLSFLQNLSLSFVQLVRTVSCLLPVACFALTTKNTGDCSGLQFLLFVFVFTFQATRCNEICRWQGRGLPELASPTATQRSKWWNRSPRGAVKKDWQETSDIFSFATHVIFD